MNEEEEEYEEEEELCDVCNGDGGRYEGFQTTPHPDPQTWVDCPCCEGEGWIR